MQAGAFLKSKKKRVIEKVVTGNFAVLQQAKMFRSCIETTRLKNIKRDDETGFFFARSKKERSFIVGANLVNKNTA